MSFLSIDCCTENASFFIKIKNKTFIKILQNNKLNNDLLMKQILDFFKENDISFDDIHKIFVNQGPGNFSGLRTSLAIAKGISLSKEIKLYGYDNFIWSTANFFNKAKYIFSLIKFREKYYIKKFDSNLKSLSLPKEILENEIFNKYSDKFLIIPKKTAKYMNKKILKISNLGIANLKHNELEFLQLKGLLSEKLIKPLYLS